MDSIIPALLAVLLAETGGKTQMLARSRALAGDLGAALGALTLTSLVAYGIAAIGGYFIGQLLPAEAKDMLFGLSLLFAGLPLLLKPKPAPAMIGAKGIPSALLGFAKTQFGDAAQFIVFALAARGSSPTLAMLGGLAGVLIAALIASALGKDWPQGRLLLFVRWGIAVLLIVIGAFMAVDAMGLIYRGD
jgi:Ca2+/H+ antiporter, TMEM165/GDT1 family